MLQGTLVYQYPIGSFLAILLGLYLGVDILGHMVPLSSRQHFLFLAENRLFLCLASLFIPSPLGEAGPPLPLHLSRIMDPVLLGHSFLAAVERHKAQKINFIL